MPKGIEKYLRQNRKTKRFGAMLDRHAVIRKEIPKWKERQEGNLLARREMLNSQALRDYRVQVQNIESELGRLPPGMVRREFMLRKGTLQEKIRHLGGL